MSSQSQGHLRFCLEKSYGFRYFLTLDSGKDVGPTFINFIFFFRPSGLIKGQRFIIFLEFFQALHIFSCFSPQNQVFTSQVPTFIFFWQSFQALHLLVLQNFLCRMFIRDRFPALCLFWSLECRFL